MDPETVFTICNYGVLPFWVLLAIAPGWPGTQRAVHAVWLPFLLAVVYVWALVSTSAEGGSFGSLAGVMAFFSSPHGVLAGWVHYLVFDLFIGAWEVRDARRRRISHLMLLPCLFFTLMLGPIGLALYLALRIARTGETGLEEAEASAS